MRKFVTVLQIVLTYIVSFGCSFLCIRATLNETDVLLKLLYGFSAFITTSGFIVLLVMTYCIYLEGKNE